MDLQFSNIATCCMLGLAYSRLNQNCNMAGNPPYYLVWLNDIAIDVVCVNYF